MAWEWYASDLHPIYSDLPGATVNSGELIFLGIGKDESRVTDRIVPVAIR